MQYIRSSMLVGIFALFCAVLNLEAMEFKEESDIVLVLQD